MFVRFDGNGRQQIVCLDHGLYADMRDEIRQQYCKFWVNLVLTDTEGLKEVYVTPYEGLVRSLFRICKAF